MTKEQEYLVVPKLPKAIGWTHMLLLTLLVIGSLIVVAGASVMYLTNAEKEQDAQLIKNHQIVEHIAAEQQKTTLLASRTQRAELESTQQQLRLLLCTLDHTPEHCRGVVKDAEKIDDAIDDIQADIHRHVKVVRSEPSPAPVPVPLPEPSPGPQPSPAPSPTTTTTAPSPSPSPHVGNSDQCPPNNPKCPDN